jgi:SP family facilitated glucose transporter-like MFS transporter 8
MVVSYPLIGLLDSWILLTVFRFVMGLGVGMGSAVAPCYIGEVATLELRGALGAMNQLSITIGILFANLFGTFLFATGDNGDFCQWRSMAFLGMALAACILSTFGIPESPRFFAMQGNLKATRESLMKLRVVTDTFDDELMEIVNQTPALLRAIERQNRGDSFDAGDAPNRNETNESVSIFVPKYRKSLLVGIGMLVFQQFSGCNAVIAFVASICKDAGLSNPNLAGTLAMAAQVVFTLIACLVMEKAGRRVWLLTSVFFCALAEVGLAGYFMAVGGGADLSGYLALSMITVYIIGFSFGLGPIPWLLLAELFPTEVRGVASSIAIATNWACSFLVTLSFNALKGALGSSGVFLLYAGVVVLAGIFVICVVPETRGKNIDEVLAMLNKEHVTADKADDGLLKAQV